MCLGRLAALTSHLQAQNDGQTDTQRQAGRPGRSGWTKLTCVWGISLRGASSQCERRG